MNTRESAQPARTCNCAAQSGSQTQDADTGIDNEIPEEEKEWEWEWAAGDQTRLLGREGSRDPGRLP